MQGKNRSRRGAGRLYQKDDRWYGQWYVRGKRVKRSLGPIRHSGPSDGLTKRQAQARMLEAMTETESAPVTERLTVEEVGKRRIRELARRGRKQDTTLAIFQASAYQGDDDFVFGHPHTGRPLDRSQVSKRFKRSLQRAGVRDVRFHDLRHTFGTRMAAAGVPVRTLQAWMGHADIKTTMVYTHYASARTRSPSSTMHSTLKPWLRGLTRG